MTAPYAKVYEQDNSAYINSEQSINVFIASQAPCGPVGTRLVTNRKKFYSTYSTSNEYKSNYSTAFLNAEALFDINSPVYFCRVLPEDALYGGAVVPIGNSVKPRSLVNGLATPESFVFADATSNKTNEKFSVRCKGDLAGSLGGTYFILPGGEKYISFKTSARAESADITCNADVAGSLGGTYFILPGQTHYVWYNVNNENTDPAELSLSLLGKTAVEVKIAANEQASNVALKTQEALADVADFKVLLADVVLTIELKRAGVAKHGNSGSTGFSFVTTKIGLAESKSVVISDLEGTEVIIAPDSSAEVVASSLANVFSGIPEFTAAVDDTQRDLVIASATRPGYISDARDGEPATGFVIETITQGSDQSGSEALLFYTSDPNALDLAIKLYSNQDHPEVAPIPGTFVVEVYKDGALETAITCSRKEDAKDGNGQPLFVEIAMEASAYVRCINNPAVSDTELPASITSALKLGGGTPGTTVTTGNMINATREWANKDDFDITLILTCGWTDPAYCMHLDNLAKTRGDCCVINSIPYYIENAADYITNIVRYRKNQLNINSSYTATFSSNLLVYNSGLNKNVYIPSDGHIAGAIVNASRNYEIFYPILGFKRGILNNVLDVKRRYDYDEMSELYNVQINPIRFVPGRGIVIWGQKTMQSSASSLDRLNARLLLCSIKPQLQRFLEDVIGELNTDETRDGLTLLLNNLFDALKAKQGILAYQVACDELDPNNPNKLTATVRIQITPAVEYVELKIKLEPVGVSFE